MNTEHTAFDWTAWYASIPGIPDDWGKQPRQRGSELALRMPWRPRPATLRSPVRQPALQ